MVGHFFFRPRQKGGGENIKEKEGGKFRKGGKEKRPLPCTKEGFQKEEFISFFQPKEGGERKGGLSSPGPGKGKSTKKKGKRGIP